jgi:hypothetical protein
MVKHFLKDGTQVESVAGIVIKQKDFKSLYQSMENYGKRKGVNYESERTDN